MNKVRITILWLLMASMLVIVPVVGAASPPANNNLQTILAQTDAGSDEAPPEDTAVSDSFLSPELNRIFASLGLYILTMFTLALGTEVSVDVVKPLFGLKSKPTARKTLEEFESLLPGKPADFGISVEEQARLQAQIARLKTVLEPVAQADDIIGQIKDGDVVTAVNQLLQATGTFKPGQTIDNTIKASLTNLANTLAARFNLPPYLTQPVTEQVAKTISQINLTDAQAVVQEAYAQLRAGLLSAWIRQQITEINADTRAVIEERYNLQIKPQLANLGFSPKAEQAIHEWLNNFLNELDTYTGHQVDIYLKSLNELLRGVERQRYLLQSPARRMWRRAREIPYIGHIAAFIEDSLNWLAGREREDLDSQTNKDYVTDGYSIGRVILELDRQHKADGDIRVRWLRLLSIFVGIILAQILRIDSADLLAGLLPVSTSGFLKTVLIAKGSVFLGIKFANELTAGILLSGLAASAGSNFWHDRLSQLQAVRSTAEAAASAFQQIAGPNKES
ncbi:MAG: hypothetical protein Kow0080_16250 [Candidatus Promineifilaceae bacterium]